MQLFDTHAHLTHKRFKADREPLIVSLPAAGITQIMVVCCSLSDYAMASALAAKFPHVHVAAGTHPSWTAELLPSDAYRLEAILASGGADAVGEIGLDYCRNATCASIQRRWFGVQLELAAAYHLPVVLHIREAYKEALDMLDAFPEPFAGSAHCFSGSYDDAVRLMDKGLHIAFGGTLTYPYDPSLRETAKRLPLDRVLLETDCPFLPPAPQKMKSRNTPKGVLRVVEELSLLRNVPIETIAAATYENAFAAFRLRRT